MSKRPSISFAKYAAVESGTAILLVAAEGKVAAEAESVVGQALLSRIIECLGIQGKTGSEPIDDCTRVVRNWSA